MELYILSERKINKRKKHVSYNTILGLENEFCCFNRGGVKTERKMGHSGNHRDTFIIRCLNHKNRIGFFSSMGIGSLENFKQTLKAVNDHLVIYIFDCWESQWDKYRSLLDFIDPYAICFAYIKAMEHFEGLGFRNCWFMPQSMDVRHFHDHGEKKSRLFMQMGRKVDKLHDLVCDYLESHHIPDEADNYVFERVKGEIIYKNIDDLAREINRSYFFIAAPQCDNNRQLTGNISEVTARFYEAMACKSLIIGCKPKDTFDILFPYQDAMIEVDEDNFKDCIEELLQDKNKYNRIVEKNYEYVMVHHRWKNRFNDLVMYLNSLNKI